MRANSAIKGVYYDLGRYMEALHSYRRYLDLTDNPASFVLERVEELEAELGL